MIPSGKRLHTYRKWTIEIGELPIQIVIFHSYVKLPEGINKNDISEYGIWKLNEHQIWGYMRC